MGGNHGLSGRDMSGNALSEENRSWAHDLGQEGERIVVMILFHEVRGERWIDEIVGITSVVIMTSL